MKSQSSLSLGDFRSDTTTRPTLEMRKIIQEADIMVDYSHDDPGIQKLQHYVAQLFSKQAALFVPTATMGNLISILSHCERGTAAILGYNNHINQYEAGGISQLGGVFAKTIPTQMDGTLKLEDIEGAISDPDDPHQAQTKVVCLENTQNAKGGLVLPISYIKSVNELVKQYGHALHLDGARVLNAAAFLDVKPSQITQYVDSVTLCLSKGLGCPFGAVIAGTHEFIKKAALERFKIVGPLRGVGFIGEAALYALEHFHTNLKRDHALMAYIADNIEKSGGGGKVKIVSERVETNMVYLEFTNHAPITTGKLEEILEDKYRLLIDHYKGKIRLVTHQDVTKEHCERLVEAFDRELK